LLHTMAASLAFVSTALFDLWFERKTPASRPSGKRMRSPLARERRPPRWPCTGPVVRLFSRLTLPSSWSVSEPPRASAAAFLFVEFIRYAYCTSDSVHHMLV